MKTLSSIVLCAAMALPAATTFSTPAEAKVLERACNKSDRGASRSLCSCIQRVADFELSRSEQKKGAKFFKEPQLAQDTRQSDHPGNEVFWKKWKKFGVTAAASCS
ncbi:MAG: hypothetical protein JXQ91_18650 [Vannielia sp.]|uniref:hypothetical protein n=1 Tax=Rhodobacterales TaxID=204455 RepID=UPI002095B043|nr:hypothetical protein [Oceanicola sp. 502str15]MCO6381325.1 hypothetical protein [Oceanicola sp. 502str15]